MRPRVYLLAVVVAAAFVVAATLKDARDTAAGPTSDAPHIAAFETSRSELTRTVETMTERLRRRPSDGAAVVRLADASMRIQRVNNDGRAVIVAENRLREFLKRVPSNYDAQRMLATVLLSEHRFGEAIAQANRIQVAYPDDAWNYGVIGDGYLELGDYEHAFAAFDRMGALQPGAPAYARTSYGLEINGDLDGALEYMQRAADGTSSNDPEAQAWHYAQLGDLLLNKGRISEARLQYERAQATFPGHPFAVAGLARIKTADGDFAGARAMLQEQLARVPSPDLAAAVGDLSAAIGDGGSAERYYAMCEQIERATWAAGVRQPQRLARFFAEHDRNIPEAVALAEEAITTRRDIFTYDALAWSYFKAGRIADAVTAMRQARRTNSRDRRILYHAAEINLAAGDRGSAVAMLSQLPAQEVKDDVMLAQALNVLRRRIGNQPSPYNSKE